MSISHKNNKNVSLVVANPKYELIPEDTLERFKKMCTDILKTWKGFSETFQWVEEDYFIPENKNDYAEINSRILKFGEIIGTFKVETDSELEKHRIKAENATVYASLYSILVDVAKKLTMAWGDFEKFAKNMEAYNTESKTKQPYKSTIERLQKAYTTLQELDVLLKSNKDQLNFYAGYKESEEEVQRSPTGTRIGSSYTNNLDAVRILIEAANRLDLRAPTKITKDNLAELMAYLRALRDCYQSMHWTSRGSHYYGDHLLFERLYNEVIEEIDALAEKAIGYTDDAYVVEVQYQTSRVATHVAEIMSHLPDMTYIQCLLFAENRLCKELIPQMLNTLEQANELSDGVENFLQGIADNHEGNIYHLQRRLKTQEEMGSKAPVEPNISPPPATAVDVNQQFSNMMNTQGIR